MKSPPDRTAQSDRLRRLLKHSAGSAAGLPNEAPGVSWNKFQEAAGNGSLHKQAIQWSYERRGLEVLIVAGSHVLLGGAGEVVAVDAATGQEVWQAPVAGRVQGLAVAHGRLVVSTADGCLHGFGTGTSSPAPKPAKTASSAAEALRSGAALLAEAIAEDSGTDRGYALVIGPEADRLAVELAARTAARIHVAESDQDRATARRQSLSQAGLYGARIQLDLVFTPGLRARDNRPLLLSFDAYNGVPYWERELPGASRTYILGDCGNLACSRDGLFVASGTRCQRLELQTGRTRGTFEVPPPADGKPGTWAYVGLEGSTLVGSSSAGYQFSDTLFAYDLRTDTLSWQCPKSVIRNATIAIQGHRVFFVEQRGQTQVPVVLDPLAQAKLAADKRRAASKAGGAAPGGDDHDPTSPVTAEPYVRSVVALDLATGKELWSQDVNLAGCGSWTSSLSLIAKDAVVVLCGTYSAYGRPSGQEGRRRAPALSAADGATLWERTLGNVVRPVVSLDRVIARPKAIGLRTGEPVLRPGPKGPIPWTIASVGACGQMSASAGMLFYRYGYTLMVNADTAAPVMTLTGMRPGCLINVIPAGGVIVQTEASSGCTCPHALQSTIVLVPPEPE